MKTESYVNVNTIYEPYSVDKTKANMVSYEGMFVFRRNEKDLI